MWALFDFCCHGLLCDDVKSFKVEYENKIQDGRDRSASHREREVGIEAEKALRKKIAPYFLRREKGVLFGNDPAGQASNPSRASESAAAVSIDGDEEGVGTASEAPAASLPSSSTATATTKTATLSKKNDLIVWLKLTCAQRELYTTFLRSAEVKRVLNKTGSALAALTVLKKICQHPVLLKKGATARASATEFDDFIDDSELGDSGADDSIECEEDAQSDEEGDGGKSMRLPADFSQLVESTLKTAILDDDDDEDEDDGDSATSGEPRGIGGVAAVPRGSKQKHKPRAKGYGGSGICHEAVSCKISFLRRLLNELSREGHRTLVFSQTRMVLDMVEETVRELGLTFRRIDGTVMRNGERARRVQEFQTDESIPIFLLTSKVGGLGLTLTGADRVVIVDPAWNPSLDDQSVDRAYRLGQDKDVVVYRLITCGTMEEKIYRKQVFKAGLMRTATQSRDHQRYFTQQELRELFAAKDECFNFSETRQQLGLLHKDQTKISPQLAAHIASLNDLGADGVSYHDQLFSRDKDSSEASAKADYEPAGRSRRNGGGSAPQGHVLFRTVGAFLRGNIVSVDRRLTSWDDCVLAQAKQGLLAGQGGSSSGAPSVISLVDEEDKAREREQFLQRCAREQKLASVTEQLARQRQLLRATGLRLPDGGQKIRDRIQELEVEREALVAQATGASALSAIVVPDSPADSTNSDGAHKPGSLPPNKTQQSSAPDEGRESLDGLMRTLGGLSLQH
eukprot:jgi/Mesvir1/16129/Mv08409-RA.2